MPLFMDVHHMDGGVSAADVATAHVRDLEEQGKYGVEYKQYWVDESAGRIFCLVEAPDAEAANRVHREAHGLVADEIFQVSEGS
jgi:hypothetical protein